MSSNSGRPQQRQDQDIKAEGLNIGLFYPSWEPGKEYKPKDIVRHGLDDEGNPQLFAVMQGHRSQADWLPGPAMEALYKAIGFTNDGTPVWTQPQGGHDAYQLDDIVMHNGQKWRSTISGNVWEPGVYGWTVEA